jgi:hypothetical protein
METETQQMSWFGSLAKQQWQFAGFVLGDLSFGRDAVLFGV